MTAAPAPAVLVKGDDPALVNVAVAAACEEALAGEERSFALEELGGDDLTVEAIIDAARTPPFLSARRVLVVRDVGRWSTEAVEPLVEYLAAPEATTSLVLVAGGGKTSIRLSNAVKKVGRVVDATPGPGAATKKWLTDQLANAPLRFDAAAGARLAEHLGEDLGRLPQVVETLVSAYGAGARVGVADIEPFLGGAGGVAPWDLTDAIDRGDTAAALTALDRMTGAGERHPLAVLATLQRHFGAMVRLDGSGIRSEAEAAAVVGMAPYPAKKVMNQGTRLGGERVGRAITLIAQADLDLRGVRNLPGNLTLEILVARLARLRTAPSAAPTSGR